MLSIGVMSGGQVGYYLGLAREDYYLEGGEPPGVWMGSGATVLGLTGQVDADHLYNLFDGLAPDGTRSLVQRQRHEGKQAHRPGWDFTFSAPKSVSALWSQADEASRKLIQSAQLRAVEAALDYLEETSAFTRRGRGIQEACKLIVATFEHSTSRALDPQLHTHALLLNVATRSDGGTSTVSSLQLFNAKMVAGAIYRAELAATLEKTLGVKAVRRGLWFEIEGVSQRLCESFSKRRAAIEEQIKEQGISTAKGAAIVTIETRSSKADASRSSLFKDWIREGELVGWSTRDASRILGSFKRGKPDLAGAISSALSRLMSEGAHFSERELTRCLAEEGQGRGLDARRIRTLVREVLEDSPDIVRLGIASKSPRFTLASVFAAEEAFFKECKTLAARKNHPVSASSVDKAISAAGELNAEQRDAIRRLTSETGDIAIMSGIAGSGKTRTLATAARIWESEGYRVRGLTLSGRAARELQSGGKIDSTTIAKSLYELDKSSFPVKWSSEGKRLYFDFSGCNYEISPKTILVVDEAGMVNTADFKRLASECRKNGAKLVAAGDPRQLQAVFGASPFSEMIHRFGSAALNTVMRQKDRWAQEAVQEFAAGNAGDALREYAKRGHVKVKPTQKEARDALIEAWKSSEAAVKDRLILTDKREDAKVLNKLAQQARKGSLGITWTTVGEEKLYLGDRVCFTQTSQTRGINNGDRGELVAINPLPGKKAATIKLDNGERITVDTSKFPYLDLGYASTTHRAQGETVQEAFVLTGSTMQDRHLAYVQASRAKDRTQFFMTDAEAGPELATISKTMSRARPKTTGHEEIRKQRIIAPAKVETIAPVEVPPVEVEKEIPAPKSEIRKGRGISI